VTIGEPLKVLLVEDDEDDYILARDLVSEFQGRQVHLEWMKNFATGLDAMTLNQHDVCLVDYRLGAQNGVELLRAAIERGCKAPIILLTGQGEHEIDLEAMKAGAADYLVKGRLDGGLLERSIRYALERKRGVDLAASEQARLAAFGEDIGLALTRRDALDTILHRCATAMVHYLHAALSRIWIYDPDEKALKLQAAAGPVEEAGPSINEQPRVAIELAQIAEGRPILISRVLGDNRVPDQAWARREGIVAYAGYPLMLEDRLVGLMSIFAKNPLTEAIIQEMASVANGIALCIERKRSAEALDASEIKYRSVVDNIKEVIFQADREGRWTFLNPAWTEITGFRTKLSLGTKFADYIHPDDRDRHQEIIYEVIERKKSYCRDETRYVAADGSFRWMEVYAQPILNTNDNVFGISGTLSDITERKRAEAEIQKLAAFPRFNPDPVLELAADGTLTYLNNAAREMTRLLEVPNPEAILPCNAPAVVQECLRQGRSKLSQQVQKNGRTLSWSFFPIMASQVVHCYGADVTERLNLEAQLRHAQKLESVGQLAAGVAHDFNNILTIIQGHSDRLVVQCESNPAVVEPLKQVSAAAKRAAALTQQLLMFSRKQKMQPKVLDLNKVIGNLGKMLQRLLGDDIVLEQSCEPALPAIEADTGMIEQIIMNLSVNSRDAMPKGGKLTISTKAVDIDGAYVQQHPESHPGWFVRLEVTDNGTGMRQETLSRMFEPFFTTKEVGKGTGLGLATVYGIVKQHRGWLDVRSQLGAGTTFTIHLPATNKSFDTTVDKPPIKPTVKGGSETILLVEDEPVLRELARIILKDYNYQVLEASTGGEAIKVWEEHHGEVDLLLTDMVMPEGMTGRELADELKKRKPALKVVYTSGYSSDVMGGGDLELRDSRFLQKPYAPPLLAKTVRECLDF
jgi:two-component system, cell cycle sensor histidine kinase and response regulator CckA